MKFIPNSYPLNSYLYSQKFHFHTLNGWISDPMGCTVEDELYLLWYRNNEEFVSKNGKRKAFHKGGNSSNRFHIRQHYDEYKERCEKANIPLHHWAIPPHVHKAAKAEAEAEQRAEGTKMQGQQQLAFKIITGPREFTRAGTLHAIANLIATNNQVSC